MLGRKRGCGRAGRRARVGGRLTTRCECPDIGVCRQTPSCGLPRSFQSHRDTEVCMALIKSRRPLARTAPAFPGFMPMPTFDDLENRMQKMFDGNFFAPFEGFAQP